MLLLTSMRESFLLFVLATSFFASAQTSNSPPHTPAGAAPGGRPQAGQPAATSQAPSRPQISDEEAMAQAAKVAEATTDWDTSTTPGIKTEVILIKKGDYQGKPMVDYRVKISGAPPGREYTLMAWPVLLQQPAAVMEGLVIAADGTVGCPAESSRNCAQRIKGAELHLTYVPAKGEIYRHALISEDHQTRIFFSIIPDPMIATDKACSLEAVRLSPQFELVMLRGKGFQPGEEIRFHSQSYQENHDVTVTADARGEFGAHLTPMIKGRVAGSTTVMAAGKSCAPTISFDWGTPPQANSVLPGAARQSQ